MERAADGEAKRIRAPTELIEGWRRARVGSSAHGHCWLEKSSCGRIDTPRGRGDGVLRTTGMVAMLSLGIPSLIKSGTRRSEGC
jgi:hypothetical protein